MGRRGERHADVLGRKSEIRDEAHLTWYPALVSGPGVRPLEPGAPDLLDPGGIKLEPAHIPGMGPEMR